MGAISLRHGILDYKKDQVATPPAPSYPTDYIAWYKFEETSDTTANDETGNHDATISSNITLNQTGKVGQCYLFNGTASTGGIVTYNGSLISGTTAWTASAWVKMTDNGASNHIIFSSWNHPNECYVVRWRPISEYVRPGQIEFYATTNNGRQYVFSGSSLRITDSNWHHVVARYNGSNLQIFIDNVSSGTTNQTGTMNTNTYEYIGGDPTWTDHYTNGNIDQVMYYDYALTDTEIGELYNSGSGV